MQCPPGLFDLDVGGLFGRVGHHPVRVVAGGAVAVVGVEVEVDAGVAAVVFRLFSTNLGVGRPGDTPRALK